MTRTLSLEDLLGLDFATLPQVQEFPAMQFFPAEWLTGVATLAMSAEQQGGFINLLAHAWGQKPPCSLPNDDTKLAGYSRLGNRWAKVGALVREQFVRCGDGRLRNPKQVAVWLGMKDLREKRRSSRKGDRFVSTKPNVCDDKRSALSPPAVAIADAEAIAAATATAATPTENARASADPDWEGVRRIVETFPPTIRPNPQLVVLWIEKLGGSVDEVLAVVWKYPNKGPDYIRKAIDSRAREIQEKQHDRPIDSSGGNGRRDRGSRSGDAAEDARGAGPRLGRFKPRTA